MLSAHVVHLQALAPEIASQLPRAPVLATTLLQHLAVSREATAETKELLLLDALRRALVLAPRTGSCAVVVNVHMVAAVPVAALVTLSTVMAGRRVGVRWRHGGTVGIGWPESNYAESLLIPAA